MIFAIAPTAIATTAPATQQIVPIVTRVTTDAIVDFCFMEEE
jgi:hypothetical protein